MGYIETFTAKLLSTSTADTYDEAIQEWVYHGEAFEEVGYCICGHPITDNRIVRNRLNGKHLIVGNCCIRKFCIERAHWNRSRAAYLEYALARASNPTAKRFVQDLQEKNARYPTLRMTERQKQWLEQIAGRPYRWNYHWETPILV